MLPHFLAQNDRESVNEYLTKPAKLMRVILDNSCSGTISLADEIEYLQLYVDSTINNEPRGIIDLPLYLGY